MAAASKNTAAMKLRSGERAITTARNKKETEVAPTTIRNRPRTARVAQRSTASIQEPLTKTSIVSKQEPAATKVIVSEKKPVAKKSVVSKHKNASTKLIASERKSAATIISGRKSIAKIGEGDDEQTVSISEDPISGKERESSGDHHGSYIQCSHQGTGLFIQSGDQLLASDGRVNGTSTMPMTFSDNEMLTEVVTLPVEERPSHDRYFVYFLTSYHGAKELWKRHQRLSMIWVDDFPENLNYKRGKVYILQNYTDHSNIELLDDVNTINNEEGVFIDQHHFFEQRFPEEDERRCIETRRAWYPDQDSDVEEV